MSTFYSLLRSTGGIDRSPPSSIVEEIPQTIFARVYCPGVLRTAAATHCGVPLRFLILIMTARHIFEHCHDHTLQDT